MTILATTPYGELPAHVRERLGLRPDQANVHLRLELRPLAATLTDERANQLRDRIYAAVHQGPHAEWASARSDAHEARNR